ncbi:DUF732 domain-containing protein [Mycobacterium sp. SMC-2]|uniref:DUF732 domain-containing protein n=1 Tax=Mycobacterium sp. SMC-2 TaxID=2857058 RepID=UPI0021B17607|nr:DUF732 domain-containing protein [Mycobacterium sp. SMC-2]UXA07271.1 DUF732 domain-containing protein [Mycobacterium sp. SMC-2]
MFTGFTGQVGAVVAIIVVLTGGATLRGGAVTADPNQDEQFKALLDQEEIPALEGVPTLIDTAHKICRVLDSGIPVGTIVGAMMNNAYTQDPAERLYPPARLESTMTRFIIASVEAYCPRDQRKIATIMPNPALAPSGPAHPAGAHLHGAASDLVRKPARTGVVAAPRVIDDDAHSTAPAGLIGALPSGDMTAPTQPQIPPPAPGEHLQSPPRPTAAPPVPKRPPPPPQQPPPPPPQQPPPPPQQLEPPALAPQPGGGDGSGGGGGGNTGGTGGTGGGGVGGGGTGGGGPVESPPAPHGPPGYVRLAP